MKPGRKPKPTALKIIEGNPGKRPLNENEPQYKKGVPEYTEVLDDIAIKEWERIKQQLDRSGIITIFDMASLAAYCQLYSRWVQLENDIKVEGLTIESIRYNKNGDVISTTEIINPKVKEARLTLQQMRAFCSEFGITPSSRSRLSVKPAEDEDEGMEQFFKDGVS